MAAKEKKTGKKIDIEVGEDTVDVATELTLEEELERCQEQLKAEGERRLRALAESENLKKRLIREKEEFVKFASKNVIVDLLPALDNLDLALEHGRSNEACKDFVMGVDMTRKALMEALGRHGVTEFGEAGQPFSPELHEAVGTEADTSMKPEMIAKVIQKGFMLNERLMRPAKVLVNKP